MMITMLRFVVLFFMITNAEDSVDSSFTSNRQVSFDSCWKSNAGLISEPNQFLLLHEAENSVRWHDFGVVDHKILEFVFHNFAGRGVHFVRGNSINVQRASQRHLGHQNHMPGNANGTASKVVNHTILKGRTLLEPKLAKRLQKRNRIAI
jgi:hypothetical protein